jgi:hypothetical protein
VALNHARKLILVVTDGGDGFHFDHADWIEPIVTGTNGNRIPLTGLKWTEAKAGWGSIGVNKTVDNTPITLDGKTVDGIGTHSFSYIEYELPDGCEHFKARGVLSPGSGGKGSVEFLVLTDAAKVEVREQSAIAVSFADIDLQGPCRVRDLWKGEDLGVFTNQFSREIPLHGAGLYRLTPDRTPDKQ